jgi:hypothetical protein
MQDHGTSGNPMPRPRGTVRGLGVADVLAAQLEPSQLPRCFDELHTLAAAVESSAALSDLDDDDGRRQELRRLTEIRAALVDAIARGQLELVGPAPLVSLLIGGAALHAVSEPAAAVESLHAGSETSRAELRRLNTAAACWMTTYLDLSEVEWFCFGGDA